MDAALLTSPPWDLAAPEAAVHAVQSAVAASSGPQDGQAGVAGAPAQCSAAERALLQIYVAVMAITKAGLLLVDHGVTVAYLYLSSMGAQLPRCGVFEPWTG